ncbi:DUF397 domain-containing protein [Nocardia sp. NPDC127579]|uniref:DUF397 domain-containing protein n=1 Tax=Nocardia sp. NPDC127579 TaxID=3345402 RepID=UPI00363CB42B
MMHKCDLDGVPIFKAACGPDGACVGFGTLADGSVAVFNTGDGDSGPVVVFTAREWDAFLRGVRTATFVPA